MYIWIGCRLPECFEKSLRAKCLAENEKIGLDTTAFSLPQHISLKISFETDRGEELLSWLRAYLSRQPAFCVCLQAAEQVPGVLWLGVAENRELDRLHRELDALLLERFGVPQHPFDKCFRFHSSLFLDADGEKLRCMQQALWDLPLPQWMSVDSFLLGISPDGRGDNYRVLAEIPAKVL